ncbi:hypothetical protein IV417_14815 [Alphaproteobacteria bacterium KMM 3653]|uniref:Uncharacterized protein n=1 Tax=Harenicola maris TaxID=2841044 RepID=A0AAP2G4U2_9RHOB|nr:hypothetical protein [Harenicola maris]
MSTLMWIGIFVTLLGLAGIIGVMFRAIQIKRADLPQDEFRVKLQGLAPWNMGALGVASIGMMLVIAGSILR